MPPETAFDDTQRSALAAALQAFGPTQRWLESVSASTRDARSIPFRTAHAAAARRLAADGRGLASALLPGCAWLPGHWTVADVARFRLVELALAACPEAERPSVFDALFRGGELGEQVSLLRTLALHACSAEFLETAVEACRTNAVAVFESIACENPFPAAHFAPLAFNQMVIKAIFLEVSVRRVRDLERRITHELVRMAEGLASERARAGRSIPEDIDFIRRGASPS